MYRPTFNIGIEEEYQIIEPESRALLGYVSQSMAGDRTVVHEQAPELNLVAQLSSGIIESGTPVCADIQEAREQLLRTRANVLNVAHQNGVRVAAAGTHPFTHWEEAVLSARYQAMVEDAQLTARRMLAFGMRVHIGVEDRELAVDVMNAVRYLLPHILTLSTSSPFWHGRNTGLKSYRKVLLDALPRTGIPGTFKSYQEYRTYVDTLIRTNSIPDASRIWYDIVPHYRFPTLIIRICDMTPDYRDCLAITALLQATVAWMVDLRQRNMTFRIYDSILINENRWRAVRYGLDGQLVDFGIEQPVPVRDLIRELLTRIEPEAARLNSLDELGHIYTLLDRGSSADRQLKVWKENDQDLTAVVDAVIRETEALA